MRFVRELVLRRVIDENRFNEEALFQASSFVDTLSLTAKAFHKPAWCYIDDVDLMASFSVQSGTGCILDDPHHLSELQTRL